MWFDDLKVTTVELCVKKSQIGGEEGFQCFKVEVPVEYCSIDFAQIEHTNCITLVVALMVVY